MLISMVFECVPADTLACSATKCVLNMVEYYILKHILVKGWVPWQTSFDIWINSNNYFANLKVIQINGHLGTIPFTKHSSDVAKR